MRTKKPSFRVTREITVAVGGKVPIEAECSCCADALFKIKVDKRETYHQPVRELYLNRLKRAFQAHVEIAHPAEPERKTPRLRRKE
jgi:hypothetical protein